MAKARKYFTINPTLAPGQTIPYPLSGNYLTCLDATSPFRVAFDGEDFAEFDAGFTAEIAGGFQKVWIENTSGADNTVKLAVGNGRFNDGRLTASGTLDVADPGAGRESFADVVSALQTQIADLIAAHREDQQLRKRVGTLAGASYSSVASSASTPVTSGANTNGVIIRFAGTFANGGDNNQYVKVGGNFLLQVRASANENNSGGSQWVENIFVPPGLSIEIEAQAASRTWIWYEVL